MPLAPPQSEHQRYHVRCVVVRPDLYGRTGWVEVVRDTTFLKGRKHRHFVRLDSDDPQHPACIVDIRDLLLDPAGLPPHARQHYRRPW